MRFLGVTLFSRHVFLRQEYLAAAIEYLEDDKNELNAEDIMGIWVASDDSTVVERVKEIAPFYLPNVENGTNTLELWRDRRRTASERDSHAFGSFGEQKRRRDRSRQHPPLHTKT